MILREDNSGCRLGFNVGFVLGHASIDGGGFSVAVPEELLQRKCVHASAVHQGSKRVLGAVWLKMSLTAKRVMPEPSLDVNKNTLPSSLRSRSQAARARFSSSRGLGSDSSGRFVCREPLRRWQ